MRLRFLFISGLLLAISAGARWVLAGLAGSWARRIGPRLSMQTRRIKIVIAVLVLVTPLLRLITRRSHSALASELLAIMMLEVMTVMIAVIPIAIVSLLARGVRERVK